MPRFDMPINTTDQSFDRVLQAGLPVALVISAAGKLDPSLEETLRQVAQTDAGRLLVVKAVAADSPQIAARFGGPHPALITFRDGEEVSRATGITSASFRAHASYLLGRGPQPNGTHAEGTPPSQARPSQAPAKPIIVTDASFQQDVLQSDLPVLVDLWAPWCGPCHMIAPIVERVAAAYAGRLKVAKLNVDENPLTANTLHVQGIPTLLIFRGGRVVDRIVGAAPEPLLRGKIDAALRTH